MKIKKSIIVTQFDNPFYRDNPTTPTDKNTALLIYRVTTAKNTLTPIIDEKIYPTELQRLIDGGMDVTIKPTP